ncbi:hypothetical protein PLCT2_02760 [Planctomycetaceae bacterium]|nr:hypothetical protein PLCT2_02760 [Planctomycetaceae bacterium]
MVPSIGSFVTCDDAELTAEGYVLSLPGSEFAGTIVTVFAELFSLRAGTTIRAYLVGPDGERADFPSEELVPQNTRYLQCAFILGSVELRAGPYRMQLFVDNMLLAEKDVLLGVTS